MGHQSILELISTYDPYILRKDGCKISADYVFKLRSSWNCWDTLKGLEHQ